MIGKFLSGLIALGLFFSITFNFKISEAPPFFLSNVVILGLNLLIMIYIVLNLRRVKLYMTGVFTLIFIITLIYILSLGNKNASVVFPKVLLGVITYFAFSRFFSIRNINIIPILFGFSIGTALSPFFQIDFSEISNLNTANRIKVDNLGNFNAYAYLIATSLVISIYLFTKVNNKASKIFIALLQFPLIIVQILTLSRGGVFALVIGIVFYNLTVSRKTKIYFLLSLIGVFMFVSFILLKLEGTEVFINRFFNADKNDDFDSGRSLIYLVLINDLFSSISSLLLGFGFGAIDLKIFAESDILSAHNTYLDVFYSCGLFGLFVFIFYLFNIYKQIRVLNTSKEKSLCVALFAQIVFCFFYDSYWGATQIGWIFPFLLAYIEAIYRLNNVKDSTV